MHTPDASPLDATPDTPSTKKKPKPSPPARLPEKRPPLSLLQLEARELQATAILEGVTIEYPDDLTRPTEETRQQILNVHEDLIALSPSAETPSVLPQWTTLANAGNGGWMRGAELSPDGTKMLTYGQNNLTLRDTATGAVIRTFNPQGQTFLSADFSPDGTKIVASSAQKAVSTYDVASGNKIHSIGMGQWSDVAMFLSDGVRVLAGSPEGAPRMGIWNPETGSMEQVGGGGYVTIGELREDLDLLVYTRNTKLVTRSLSTGAEQEFGDLPYDGTTSAISPDGTLVAAGDYLQGRTMVWNRQTGQLVASLQSGSGTVVDLHFLPGNILLASVGQNEFQVWDLDGSSPVLLQSTPLPGSMKLTMIPGTSTVLATNGTSIRVLTLPSVVEDRRLASVAQIHEVRTAFLDALEASDALWVPHGVNVDAFAQVSTQALQQWLEGLGGGSQEGGDLDPDGGHTAPTDAEMQEMLSDLLKTEASLLVHDLIHSGVSSDEAFVIAQGHLLSSDETDVVSRMLWEHALILLSDEYLDRREMLDLSGVASSTGTQISLEIPLDAIGGTARLEVLKGTLATHPQLSHLTADEISRLLGIIDESIGSSPAFKDVIGIGEKQFANTWNRTVNVPGVGTVTVITDTGERNWGYGQVAPFQYLGVLNGMLVSTQINTANTANPYVKPGEAGITLAFNAAPTYLSALTIQRLSATGTATLTVTLEDGTIRTIAADTGGTIHIDATVRSISLSPAQGASYGIVSVDARPIIPLALPEDLTEGQRILGSGAMLDLSRAAKVITSVSGRIYAQDPSDVVTIAVYRGEEKIDEIHVTDGTFVINEASGISSLVIKHSRITSVLVLSDVAVSTDGNEHDASWESPSSATNRDLSLLSAPQWETGASYNWIDIAKQHNVLFRYGGQNVTINGGLKEGVSGILDTTLYNRLEVRTMGGGSVSINQLYYVNATGMHVLPTNRYELVSPNVAIIFPGGPEHVVVGMAGSGQLDTPFIASRGESFEEVAPSVSPDVHAAWHAWKIQPGNEGWTTIPSSVSDRAVYLTTGTYGSLWEVRNDGLTGVQVTVRVHVGSTGTSADPVQKEYSTFLGAMQRTGLETNFSLGTLGDKVSIEIIRADGGPSVSQTRSISVPASSEVRVLDEESGKLVWVSNYQMPDASALGRLARIYSKVALAIGDPDLRIAAERLNMAQTPEEQQEAYTALTNIPAQDPSLAAQLAKNAEFLAKERMGENGVDIGGVGDLFDQSTATEQTFEDVLDMYDNEPTLLPFAIAQDSPAARIFLGVLQELEGKTFMEHITIAKAVETVTLIPYYKILAKFQEGSNVAVQAAIPMRKLFEDAGYGHIFGQNFITPEYVSLPSQSPESDRSLFPIHVHHAEDGVVQGEDVVLRFDVKTGTSAMAYAYVYLIDSNGQQIGGPLTSIIHGLAVTIPQGEINTRLALDDNPSIPGTMSRKIQIKVAVWFEDSQGAASGGVTQSFYFLKDNPASSIPLQPGEYSVHPDIDRASAENAFLKSMAFPVEGTSWSYSLISTYHSGKGLYALDLNLSGEADNGKSVFSPISGDIPKGGIDLLNGRVTINTTKDGNTFSVTLRHLEHIFEDVTGMQYEGLAEVARRLQPTYFPATPLPYQMQADDLIELLDEIPDAKAVLDVARSRIAVVQLEIDRLIGDGYAISLSEKLGGAGDEGASQGTHVHMDAQLNGSAVNLFAWADAYIPDAVVAKTPIGGRTLDMHFDASAKTLVSSEERIALVRVQEGSKGVNHALAWEDGKTYDQMERVEWREIPEVQLEDGTRLLNYSGWFRTNTDGSISQWKDSDWIDIIIL